MPNIAESSQAKRLFSNILRDCVDEEEKLSKRQCVRFDDDIAVLKVSKTSSEDEYDLSFIEQEEEDEDVDFVISIGEDGDWDYTITTKAPSAPKNSRPTSPYAGCDRRLCEELYMMWSREAEEEKDSSLFRVNSSSSMGNNLKISIKACNDDTDDGDIGAASTNDDVPMLPLITPPSSPRRIETFSSDGATTEVATICEWPYGLTVDNAITAALESAPLILPPGSSCAER